MNKIEMNEAKKVSGGRWQCTRCKRKFWLWTQAYGAHRTNCIAPIKWILW